MTARRLLLAFLVLGLFAPRGALALDWEIERNFRYFLYPSDVAVQRVARDLYSAEKGAPPTPQQLEDFVNGGTFWSTKLSEAGDRAKSWPIDWPGGADATPYDLVKQLRAEEGRPPPPAEAELDRRGWASLIVRERPDQPTLTGSTATCWNPVQRLHNGCAVWGDYARAPGWIVRVFDPGAAAGQTCQWGFAGAVPAGADPRTFIAATQRALKAGPTTVSGDCRELSLVVPSDPNDPKSVAGKAMVTRTMPDGSQTSVTAAPRDRLVIGFGDSFTSGEGNPELIAHFSGAPWTGGNLPARAPDPTSLKGKDTRAQWTDRWCHRSVYSWQIRTALAAALSDPRQSFNHSSLRLLGRDHPGGHPLRLQRRRVERRNRQGRHRQPVGDRARLSGNLRATGLPFLLRLGRALVRTDRAPDRGAGAGARLLRRRGARAAPRDHALRAEESLQARSGRAPDRYRRQ
jgi:hypothetical protein